MPHFEFLNEALRQGNASGSGSGMFPNGWNQRNGPFPGQFSPQDMQQLAMMQKGMKGKGKGKGAKNKGWRPEKSYESPGKKSSPVMSEEKETPPKEEKRSDKGEQPVIEPAKCEEADDDKSVNQAVDTSSDRIETPAE